LTNPLRKSFALWLALSRDGLWFNRRGYWHRRKQPQLLPQEFNDRIPVRYQKKWKAADMPLIKKYEDFGDEMSEREVIEVCNSAGIITGDMYKIYVAKLGDRNSAAHPSAIHVTQVQAEGFIDSLIRNTVLLLKI
jgi:hypothetical protein